MVRFEGSRWGAEHARRLGTGNPTFNLMEVRVSEMQGRRREAGSEDPEGGPTSGSFDADLDRMHHLSFLSANEGTTALMFDPGPGPDSQQ